MLGSKEPFNFNSNLDMHDCKSIDEYIILDSTTMFNTKII